MLRSFELVRSFFSLDGRTLKVYDLVQAQRSGEDCFLEVIQIYFVSGRG